MSEVEKIKERYSRRQQLPEKTIYSPFNPAVYMAIQEKKLTLIKLLTFANFLPVSNKKVLEIGCGSGSNLLELISLGFLPENLIGNELLDYRANDAKHLLPTSTQIILGDAAKLDFEDNLFDIVYQSTVFTSILDNSFQQKLADRMWAMTKYGGGIIWYDFIYNNPKNPDVRGVPIKRIKELFPKAKIKVWPITLIPIISRFVTKIHPSMYSVFNLTPFLRSHVLCWIQKL